MNVLYELYDTTSYNPPLTALIKFVIFFVVLAKGRLTARQSYRRCKVKNCVDPRLKSNAIIKIESSYEQYSVRRAGEIRKW